jgi:aminoglycoside phosphotransferase (APT) family kinase protein
VIALPVQDTYEAAPLLSPGPLERKAMFYLKSDVALPNSRLRSLAAQAQAELAARGPKVADLIERADLTGEISPLAAGTYHIVHRVLRANGPSLVVRSTLPDLFVEDHTLSIERRVRGWLAPGGMGHLVPETYATGLRSRGAPFDFAILAFATGTPLRDLGDPILDEEPSYLGALGWALQAVHSIEAQGAGLLDYDSGVATHPRGVHAHWSDYICVRLEEHVQACSDAGYVDHALAQRILRQFNDVAPSLDRRPMRLLHGDPGTHNVCVDSVTKLATALIDWEDCLIGDPLFDVAMVSTFQPVRRMPAFLAGYGLDHPNQEDERLIALYFLRIALSKTVHRLRFDIKDKPGRSPGHYRINRAIDELERLS